MIKLSFCITCMNRLFQIKETLPQNLIDNSKDKDRIELIVVDFNSTDGLKDWILNTFQTELQEGYLKYFHTEELKYWHPCIAKNTSHLLGTGEILVNLDCDNFTGKNGGKLIIDLFNKHRPDQKIFIHQGSGIFGAGNAGRITQYKHDFLNIGGYDESLSCAGAEDGDLINRYVKSGLKRINYTDTKFNKAIRNNKALNLKYTEFPLGNWKKLNCRNIIHSRNNLKNDILKANQKKSSIGVLCIQLFSNSTN